MPLHRRDVLSGLAVAGVAGCARAQPAEADARAVVPPAGRRTLRDILAATGSPALGVLVLQGRDVLRLEVAGRRRADRPDPVAPGDLWHIGSNTKAMTAALYARLVEDGRAAWDATVPSLFPEARVDAAWSSVTVEHLLAHRSGLNDAEVAGGSWLMARRLDAGTPRAQRAVQARRLLAIAPNGPRAGFRYSNIGYVLVGAAIERILDASWEDAMRRRLFAPLGMSSAGFGAPTGAQPWGHLAADFPVDPQGFFPPADNPPILGPAGTVHLSLADYARWLTVFTTGGSGWLSPGSVRRLTTPAPGAAPAYALGWGVGRAAWAGETPVLTHRGSNTLWTATVQVAPSRGTALAVVSNAPLAGGGDRANDLALQMLAASLPAAGPASS